jgi:hypothetical protein
MHALAPSSARVTCTVGCASAEVSSILARAALLPLHNARSAFVALMTAFSCVSGQLDAAAIRRSRASTAPSDVIVCGGDCHHIVKCKSISVLTLQEEGSNESATSFSAHMSFCEMGS